MLDSLLTILVFGVQTLLAAGITHNVYKKHDYILYFEDIFIFILLAIIPGIALITVINHLIVSDTVVYKKNKDNHDN